MEQQNEKQQKQMADEMTKTLQLKEGAMSLQREKEMQEYAKQKHQMELSLEQIKTYEQKMEKAKQEMAQEMAQQKSIEMLAFFSAWSYLFFSRSDRRSPSRRMRTWHTHTMCLSNYM